MGSTEEVVNALSDMTVDRLEMDKRDVEVIVGADVGKGHIDCSRVQLRIF